MAEQQLLMADLKRRLFAFLQRKLPETYSLILNDDLVRICNRVQKDINVEAGGIWVERYDKKLDADIQTLEVQRSIRQVYYFKQESDDWKDQRYGWVGDTFVFQKEIKKDTKINIIYLGDIEDVTIDDNSAIDLPGYALEPFYDLVQDRFLVEFGDGDAATYTARLTALSEQIRKFEPNDMLEGIPPSWQVAQWSSSSKHDITDQRISKDAVGVDVTGIPFITT